jgi:hypothetical protein
VKSITEWSESETGTGRGIKDERNQNDYVLPLAFNLGEDY